MKRSPNLILFLISSFFSFLCFELYLQEKDTGWGNAPLESSKILHHAHPKNYRYKFYMVGESEESNHLVYYNSDGLRADTQNLKKKNDDNKIAFMGDSFTEAGQVSYAQSFPGIVDYNSDAIVKNYGVSSYSPILYLLQWRKEVKDFAPDHVILQLYQNDIGDDLYYWDRSIKDEEGNILAVPGRDATLMRKILRKSYTLRFFRKLYIQLKWRYHNDEKNIYNVGGFIEPVIKVTPLSYNTVLELKNEVEISGAQFTLMVIPSKFNAQTKNIRNKKEEFSDQWKVFCENENINFIDLVKTFRNNVKIDSISKSPFFEYDIHLNSFGHSIIGNELINYLQID